MPTKKEKLDGDGKVKATMLQAHLGWAEQQVPDALGRLAAKLDEESSAYVTGRVLATAWVPLRCLVRIDRAIAELAGGAAEETLRRMGFHSATVNLGGVYRVFVAKEPHRFFTRMTLLHGRFQSFGSPVYEQTGERSGRIRLEGCQEYSPLHCASALGYYEGALHMMKVPGPVRAVEASCQCAGDPVCLFELGW